MDDLDVSVTAGGSSRLSVMGDLDACRAALVEGLLRVLVDAGAAKVTVDLSGLRFLDCSGLGALVAGARLATDRGGALQVGAVSPRARRVITLAGAGYLLEAA